MVGIFAESASDPESFMALLEFASCSELDELELVVHRAGREQLAGAQRANEGAGHWPGEVMAALEQLPLVGLELDGQLGGQPMGTSAKAVILMTLALYDAGGLPGADQMGPAVGAIELCPDQDLANMVAQQCLAGEAGCGFTVVDPHLGFRRLDWAPGWSEPVNGVELGWIWVSQSNSLSLYRITGDVDPVDALAFQSSGGLSVDSAATTLVDQWDLSERSALYVRARARLWACCIAVGVAQAAIDETIAYTTERVVFGKPVAHHQANAFDLAGVAAGVHGARLAVLNAAAAFDRGHPDAGFWATQAWLEATDSAFVATNLGIQLLGGHGFLVDHLAEKRFREARHLALLFGGRDWAELDVSDHVLTVPDPLSLTPTDPEVSR